MKPDQKLRLREALRDLFGWHVGMVTECDGAWDVVEELALKYIEAPVRLAGDGWLWGRAWLPDLESPANWGHWLTAYENFVGCPARWLVDLHMDSTLPPLLMRVICARAALGQFEVPPSVLAWWEYEQGEGSDG